MLDLWLRRLDEEGAIGCTTYYNDADGDDYGVDADTKCLCSPEGAYTAIKGSDECPDEDSTGLDANGDDCIDNISELVETLYSFVKKGIIA